MLVGIVLQVYMIVVSCTIVVWHETQLDKIVVAFPDANGCWSVHVPEVLV